MIDAPPLTRDQLRSLERDNAADAADIAQTVAVFGGPWRDFRSGIREYLDAAKKHDPRFGMGSEADLEPVRVLRIR
jgi:hypothetical protein